MDIVFNHTSKDARMLKEKPDWYYKNKMESSLIELVIGMILLT